MPEASERPEERDLPSSRGDVVEGEHRQNEVEWTGQGLLDALLGDVHAERVEAERAEESRGPPGAAPEIEHARARSA